MAANAYYTKEGIVFRRERRCVVTPDEAREYIRILARRHRVHIKGVRFTKRGGGWYGLNHTIALSKRPDLHVIAHEFAHAIQHQIKGLKATNRRWHNDQHWGIMQDLIATMRANGWVAKHMPPEPPPFENLKLSMPPEAMGSLDDDEIDELPGDLP